MNGRSLVAALCGQDNIIVVRRPFLEWLGHMSDAILIDQALYHQDIAGDDEWWSRSDDRMAGALGMSIASLGRSRARLIALGLMETARRGIPARIHYRINLQAVHDGLTAHLAARGVLVIGDKSAHDDVTDPQFTQNERTVGVIVSEPSIYEGGVEGNVKDIAQPPTERPGGAQTPPDSEPMAKPDRKPRAPKDQADAQPIALLVDALGEARGYPIANFKRHVRAAKRLLGLGHSPADVRKTVAHIRREVRIMDGQPISMETVSKYIGIVCNKRGGGLHIGAAVAAPDWLVAE